MNDLETAILEVLEAHPGGLGEIALWDELSRRGFVAFQREVLSNSMRMFRSHFALFHVLYAIRERLVSRGEGHLEIQAMSIKLTRFAVSDVVPSAAVAEHDPLRDYYLDLSHLESTTEEDLRAMLDAFWSRFAAQDRQVEALAVLGLEREASWEEVRARHRALVLEHHPDRGGDAAQLVAVNAAMRVLTAIHGR